MKETNLTVVSKKVEVVLQEQYQDLTIKYYYKEVGNQVPESVTFEVFKEENQALYFLRGSDKGASFSFFQTERIDNVGSLINKIQEACKNLMNSDASTEDTGEPSTEENVEENEN